MEIFVVSDSHRLDYGMERVISEYGPFDKMLHLGDSEVSKNELEETAQCNVEVVLGNSDRGLSHPEEILLEIGKHKILMTHGHNYGVNFGYEGLINRALEVGADTVMFGHIHVPVLLELDGITLINPGSISIPRQASRKPTWIYMNVDETGEISYEIKEL